MYKIPRFSQWMIKSTGFLRKETVHSFCCSTGGTSLLKPWGNGAQFDSSDPTGLRKEDSGLTKAAGFTGLEHYDKRAPQSRSWECRLFRAPYILETLTCAVHGMTLRSRAIGGL